MKTVDGNGRMLATNGATDMILRVQRRAGLVHPIGAVGLGVLFGLTLLAAAGCGEPDTPRSDGEETGTPTVTRPTPSRTAATPEATSNVVTASAATVLPSTPLSGTPEPLPSATPLPPMDAGEVRLKYALLDRFGSLWWCDPDFYPISRVEEQVLAEERFPEIEKDAAAFAAILAHLGYIQADSYTPPQKLAVYRDWKVLRALKLEPVSDAYHFHARFTHDEQTGVLVDGVIDPDGRITIASEEVTEPPPCPICLARGTRIATPDGPVAVEDLRAGMQIWTALADGARMRAEILAVGKTRVPAAHRVVHLLLTDGRSLLASPSHPLADGRLLGTISRGDIVDGSMVVSAEYEPYDGEFTFDVLPSGPTGTYWADGILLASTIYPSSGADPQNWDTFRGVASSAR